VLPNKDFTPLSIQVVEVRKMLHGLLKSLSTGVTPNKERAVVQS
jgi:hypothetical protein